MSKRQTSDLEFHYESDLNNHVYFDSLTQSEKELLIVDSNNTSKSHLASDSMMNL